MASNYQDIADLTAQMVASGEMSPDEQLQVHRALSQKGYGPGAPKPPQPGALAPPAPNAPPLPGMMGIDLGAVGQPVLDYAKAGYDRMTGGAAHMAQPGLEPKLQGAHDVIGGAGQMVAPSVLPAAAVSAGPVALGSGLLGGYLGGTAARETTKALGASPGTQAIAEDLGGFGGGAGVNALASKFAPAAGGLLQDAAKAQYSRVLNATTKANKATSAQIVPGLLDRGVSAGSAKGLLAQFQTKRDAAGQTLDDLWANIPKGTSVPLAPILDAMDKHASESFLSESGNPLSSQADQGIKVVQGLGQRLADESTLNTKGERVITASALRRYRQEWDRITNKANGFTSTLDDATSGGAHNIGGDAARASINSLPGVNDANQEYGFWKDASRVMGDTMQRRQGQAVPLGRKIAKYAGMSSGYSVAGAPGAAAMGAALNGLETAGASVPWNTNMARFKYGLGGLLQSGQPQQVPYWIPGLLSATRP